MRKLTLAMATLIAIGGVMLSMGGTFAMTHMTSEKTVRALCGKNLQSSGGAIGCSYKDKDLNCNKGKCYAIQMRTKGQTDAPKFVTGKKLRK
jgi:hypothetical protein